MSTNSDGKSASLPKQTTDEERNEVLRWQKYYITGLDYGYRFDIDMKNEALAEEFVDWLGENFVVDVVDRFGTAEIVSAVPPLEFIASLEKCNNQAWLDLVRKFPSKMTTNPAVQLRLALINDTCVVDDDTKKYTKDARKAIAELSNKLVNDAPNNCEVGRLIAALDHLRQAAAAFDEAATLGSEAENRKRARTDKE